MQYRRSISRSVLGIAVLITQIFSAAHASEQSSTAYEQLSKPRTSDGGHYLLSMRPNTVPVPIGKTHDWVVHLETSAGQVFVIDNISVSGGMPEHGHGFSSQPSITRYLAHGNYLLEGVRFNMAGRWRFRFEFDGPAGADTAVFEFDLSNPERTSEKDARSRLEILRSLSLDSLPALPLDPSNDMHDSHLAATLGEQLFNDKRLSAGRVVACADCHNPDFYFTDDKVLSEGHGTTNRHSMSLLGVAYFNWFYWDGRKDSLWSQALSPLEALNEMGNTRTGLVRTFFEIEEYRHGYETLFGALPAKAFLHGLPDNAGPFATGEALRAWQQLDSARQHRVNEIFSNIGKIIAAYERTLLPSRSAFDDYVDGGAADRSAAVLSAEALAGMRLFIDPARTQCLQCHNGPLFSNGEFHNIGTGEFVSGKLDLGRLYGVRDVLSDEFNCLGRYSDATEQECSAIRFLNLRDVPPGIKGAFKVPGLRNVAETAPYMHDGRYRTLAEVIDHYRFPPSQAGSLHELQPMHLSDAEAAQLLAFLQALSGNPDDE